MACPFLVVSAGRLILGRGGLARTMANLRATTAGIVERIVEGYPHWDTLRTLRQATRTQTSAKRG